MENNHSQSTTEKISNYETALQNLQSVLDRETDHIAIMATINCVLKDTLPYYFWTGFYLVKNGALIVGPYQGTLGCLRISFDRGVCGAAARTMTTQIVPDVHKFPGHIACDSKSCSEIVVPVLNANHELIAVFDVDSTAYNSFDEIDQQYLEKIMQKFFAN